ncbi:MAG TPA: hypothetical protein VH116_01445 [Gemmatimonadales bacterium]|jgi:hypothetical protein|nr:hypothetical protein [Gemmatimonadales bacterium]
MATKNPKYLPAPDGLWLHVYGIMPPQARKLFERVGALLDAEDRIARGVGRAWTGSLVSEAKDGPVTHVLIVSDSATRDDLIHLALEAELKKLDADIFIGVPMLVPQRG